MVIWRWWQGPFPQCEFRPDLPLGAARGAEEGVSTDPGQIFRVRKVLEFNTEGRDQGFRSLGRLGVEDLESEYSILERHGEGQREPLVPDGPSRSGIIGASREAAFRVDPEDSVGFEVAVPPVDVLDVLGGDDR